MARGNQADLLPVEYYHVVFTQPAAIADIAFQNPKRVYDLLFKVCGNRASADSSYRYACCRVCSGGCFSNNSPPCMINSSSMASLHR